MTLVDRESGWYWVMIESESIPFIAKWIKEEQCWDSFRLPDKATDKNLTRIGANKLNLSN